MNATRYAEVPSFSDPRGSSTDGTPLSQMLHATSPRIEGHFPFYSFSRFPLFEYAQLHTPHQGEKFPVFLASFLPHIAISNNYPSQTLIYFTEFAGLLYSFQEFGTKDEGGLFVAATLHSSSTIVSFCRRIRKRDIAVAFGIHFLLYFYIL